MQEQVKENAAFEDTGASSKKKKTDTITIKVTISPQDTKLMDVMSRVISPSDYLREAMIEWDYILNTTNRTSRCIEKTTNNDYYIPETIQLIDRTNLKNGHTRRPVTEKEQEKGYQIKVAITPDDVILYEIMSRVTIRKDFAKEAMFEWDYLLNISNKRSNYILKNTDPNKYRLDGINLYNVTGETSQSTFVNTSNNRPQGGGEESGSETKYNETSNKESSNNSYQIQGSEKNDKDDEDLDFSKGFGTSNKSEDDDEIVGLGQSNGIF